MTISPYLNYRISGSIQNAANMACYLMNAKPLSQCWVIVNLDLVEINFSKIGIEIQQLSFRKMHLISSVKWRAFCLGLNMLNIVLMFDRWPCIWFKFVLFIHVRSNIHVYKMKCPQHIEAWATWHWRHNGRDSISNHQPHDCLLNRLFGRRSKKTSKLRVTGLCVGNSPGTGEFPAQKGQ